VSAERGKLATLAQDVSATGKSAEVFHFHFRAHFLNCAQAGSQCDANPPGWMKAENLLKFVKQFVSHVKPSTK
jgi:hypothetical protein